jgi:hypothetical protein
MSFARVLIGLTLGLGVAAAAPPDDPFKPVEKKDTKPTAKANPDDPFAPARLAAKAAGAPPPSPWTVGVASPSAPPAAPSPSSATPCGT